jgi:biopolymer transport protein TolR
MRHGYDGWTETAVKWPRRIHCKMDAFPIVGLALVLLIIFMIVPPVTPHHGWGVDLPRSQYASPMPRAVREDAQIVDIARDGQVYYRNVRIIVDELPDQIRERVRNGAERKIYIRADARAKYIDVKKVLSEIGTAEIQNVCFLAEKDSP